MSLSNWSTMLQHLCCTPSLLHPWLLHLDTKKSLPFQRAVTIAACFCARSKSSGVWHISAAESGDSRILKIQYSPLLSSQLYLESKWELKALQTAWLGWWVTPLGLELVCVLMYAKPYCELPPQGGVDCAMAWLTVCILLFSRQPCLSLPQSTLSLANLGWQQRIVERKLVCEQSRFHKVLLNRDMETPLGACGLLGSHLGCQPSRI